jgi:putative oxidoreductase
MGKVTLVARLLFGLAFTVFGLNGVLMLYGHAFIPAPQEMAPDAAAWFKTMVDSHFMMPLISGVELASGLLILTGLFVPLGLAMMAPLVVGILLYHLNVDPKNLPIAWTVLAFELFLAWAYGPSFRGVLTPGAKSRWGAGSNDASSK